MKSDFMERYLYAVTRRLKPGLREDVALELRGLMEDMLLERCGDREPTEADLKAVMTQLGTPTELYARYAEDGDQCLIAQPYYTAYKLVLKIVLACVAVGLTVACLVLQLVEPRGAAETLEFWLSTEFDSMVSTFAVLTVIFAVLSRKKARMDGLFNLDDLPAVPKKSSRISVADPIVGIAFHVVFLALFLGMPQAFPAKVGDLWIPCFDVETIRGSWYILVLFSLAGVLREAVKLMERRFNRRVLQVSLGVDVISAGLCVWWLSGPPIINSQLLSHLDAVFGSEEAVATALFEGFNLLLMCAILLALTLDAVTAICKREK